MGLFVARYRFAETPPSEAEISRALRRKLRFPQVEHIEYLPENDVEVSSFLDGITHAYVDALFFELGARRIDFMTGEERPYALPSFVSRPWHEHGILTRLRIRLGFHRSLL